MPASVAAEANDMKAVVIGEASGAAMEEIMKVYPRHKAIFRSRQAAEEFSQQDPFILEGLVKSFVIRDWNDTMLG
jgi:hypothetical protein